MAPSLAALLTLIRQAPQYARLRSLLQDGQAVPPLGVIEPARALVVAALAEDVPGPKLIVTTNEERARRLVDELSGWVPGEVMVFPAPDAMPFERVPWGAEVVRQRLRAMIALLGLGGESVLVVAPANALLTPLPAAANVRESVFVLRPGQEAPLSDLTRRLVEAGYRAEALAEVPGTFSRRGGIMDIYPATAHEPVRLDFFGDMIDGMRWFDPQTQRTTGVCQRAVVSPASEAASGWDAEAMRELSTVVCDECHTAARADFERDLDILSQSGLPQAFGIYLGYLYGDGASLIDYLGAGALLLDDLVLVQDAAAEYLDRVDESRRRAELGGDLPSGLKPALLPWDDLCATLSRPGAIELGAGVGAEPPLLRELFTVQSRFGGQVRSAAEHIAAAADLGAALVVTRQVERFRELLEATGAQPLVTDDLTLPARGVTIIDGSYPEGWAMRLNDGSVLSLFTDREVFGWAKAPRRPTRRRPRSEPFMAEVEPGDYVVHVEHGIARYVGLARFTRDGGEKEYLELEYAGGDRLYIPTYQVDRVSRYIGSGEAPPTLTRLGGADWRDAKARARRAVELIADELLELYITRSVSEGVAFGADDVWQRELEAAFPYDETDDQLRTIVEVKADMERPRPMDRLIAGDVGYGKTEVALRAAFKAVTNGKQVGVLVPTTVLAQQHFDTFRRRLAAFPVSVEMMSRFRSEKDQERVLERLKQGEVDIVIGTHRLVQADVQFKDLGLVVIDEEQRFGVRHKEALKRLRKEVDVLTMTATPIPRTMNMALTGLRDLSTIDTPPEDRLAVWTYISPWEDGLVQKAIRREIARGGQVYLVHDRVRSIDLIRRRIERLVPEVRIGVGHGQLPQGQLARVMEQFTAGDLDVLISTTIIESGLDIPNANTIIIDHADRFGLAQLYQLRGRVGRGAVRAYAYLLFSPGQGLSEVARQRLRAIMEASELGSGLQIAMRDLEIRGAGDILGRRQHGHISAIGFDLYTRLLAQAVAERRKALGETEIPDEERIQAFLRPLRPSLQLNLPLVAELPDAYILDEALRLALYRRLGSLQTIEEIEEFERELVDRFGPVPEEARGLFFQTKVKVVGEALGVTAIGLEGDQFYVRLETSWLRGADIMQWLRGAARLGRGQVWIMVPRGEDWQTLLLWVLRTLLEMRSEIGAEEPSGVQRHRRRRRGSVERMAEAASDE